MKSTFKALTLRYPFLKDKEGNGYVSSWFTFNVLLLNLGSCSLFCVTTFFFFYSTLGMCL